MTATYSHKASLSSDWGPYTTQPQQGEWWRTREGKRVYIAAVMPGWFTGPYPLRVFSGTAETDSEKYTRDGGYHFDGLQSGRDLVEHLPDCTGWDWQPVKYPRYWETHDRAYYAYMRQDSATDIVLVQRDGTDYENTEVTLADRAELTEAEAMSRIEPPKPVESPDDWVTQDRVVPRNNIDLWCWIEAGKTPHEHDWQKGVSNFHRHKHGDREYPSCSEILHVRCRRKDLPPVEPPTPKKTRTIKFCEYIVWDEPGCERLVWVLESDDLLYRYRYPTGLTRTIEIPE
jgi:hypothetical protein